jgi:hypothetical protein
MKIKVKANIRKIAALEINYDYIGGENDQWVADVVDKDFSGGYYTPANLSGHPDNWSPEEGEDPDVDATLNVWAFQEDGSDPATPADPSKPDFVVEIKNGSVVTPNLPDGMVAWIEGTVVSGLIRDFWDNR